MSLPLPEQPSRNRSDSTGDSELPKHENKRPRLSQVQDNDQNYSIASNDNSNIQTISHSSILPTAVENASTSALGSPPQSPLPLSQQSQATSPRSKFTINTRPISSQSSMLDSRPGTSHGVVKHDVLSDNQKRSSSFPASSKIYQPETISISSDDEGSPIVQVAAPEDLDQDPADTHWEPIPNSHSPRRLSIRAGHVRRTFPFANQSNSAQLPAIVNRIAIEFTDGNGHDNGEMFLQVKTWTTEFADNAIAPDYAFFAEDREFWQKFPHLVSGILSRRIDIPESLHIDDLIEFFVGFARICQMMVDADVVKLESYSEATDAKSILSPLCINFLSAMQWIMHSEDIPLYDNLHRALNYSPNLIPRSVADGILKTFGTKYINSLHYLFHAMTMLYAKRPIYLDNSLTIVTHTGTIVSLLATRRETPSTNTTIADAALQDVLFATLDFYKSLNDKLDQAITKQQPWLNIESSEKVFKSISLFIASLAAHLPSFTIDLMNMANIDHTKFDEDKLVSLAVNAWRLLTALKLIKKGRMEVRVASVQIMASDLVQVYNDLIRNSHQNFNHPTVQFMVEFIRKNDVIRYLIGVDSHPQIIDRSANIIGFLCVSRSYRNEDTDIIWETVIGSQDPRTVAALIGVFQYNLENLEVGILGHLLQNFVSFPFSRFDIQVLDFTVRLIAVMSSKARELDEIEELVKLRECIIKVCVTILRELNSPDRICTEIASRTRSEFKKVITAQIHHRKGQLSLRAENDPMSSILSQLCTDIQAHTELANGSIVALTALLLEADDKECLRVARTNNLAAILLKDIAHACNNPVKENAGQRVAIEYENRFGLLQTLVYRASPTIDEPFLDGLWSNVLASSSFEPRLRNLCWSTLAAIFPHCRLRNEVMDTITQEQLPALRPQLYDDAVLRFAQQSVMYEIRHMPVELLEPQPIVVIPGIERVWDIMLTASPNTVEVEASKFIIEQYLEGDYVCGQNPQSVEATHLSLVDRCVRLVIEAAGYLKSDPDSDMTGSDLAATMPLVSANGDKYALKFHRSLLFLRKFLDYLKTKPRYTPAISDSLKDILSTFEKKGDVFETTLQVIGHKSIASAQIKWSLGKENLGAEVWQFLSDVTGWTQFILIHQGRKMLLKDSEASLEQIGIKTGSIMINKVQGSPENVPLRAVRASSPVDNKVMHHFKELYNLLELDDQFAKEVYDFLRMFSSQEEVLQRLKSMSIAPKDLLPVSKPFKLMYYARALRSCIEDESFSSEPNADFLIYGINAILSVLPTLHDLKAELPTCISIAHGLIEALVLGFRARVSKETSRRYISDHTLFAQTLLSLWSQALKVSLSNPDTFVTANQLCTPFEALVEGSLHDERVWPAFPLVDLQFCVDKTLLSHPAQDVRQASMNIIHGLTGNLSSKVVKSNDSRAPRTRFTAATIESCLAHVWLLLLSMMAKSGSNAATCEQYFECVASVFRKHHPKLTEEGTKNEICQWKDLLLEHQHIQQVGVAPTDFFVSSLAKLILQAIKVLPRTSFSDSKSFVESVFSKFLFPPLVNSRSINEGRIQQDPVLDMHTRSALYELSLALCLDGGIIGTICDRLSEALMTDKSNFQPTMNNDRQAVRSEVGFAGLRNLSNTCYLNSLFSQLFMNVQFRELLMSVNIIDQNKQRLVVELGKVFAYMQMSYEEAISPESAIDAITLWDGDQIDVTVQMDVDEFFNLLFDRLESQIIDPKVCNAFKGIYGGQLVQQIKSRECQHISERLEPFTAVQVEIKGKSTLEESLHAYVEGEVLQGENKYACTSCGKHVDAVKRACLKTVPDHLIFNLKRFDYDIMTGMRCKVNDEFGFPDVIDMAPYTLEALTNPSAAANPDIFELVGVIIHSGTAESGHYYSYIRQRPSGMSKERSWAQFNDHDVTPFDPASIRECCFGGIDTGPIQCPKFYNGYMLFYQRSSSIADFERKYSSAQSISSVRLPVAADIQAHIARQNEVFLRSYVAQDPSHAKFVRMLLQLKQSNEQLSCHPVHQEVNSKLLIVALDYMNQLSARWKEIPEVEECLDLIRHYVADCEFCSETVLNWFLKDENLANNLVRSCYVVVRKGFMNLIATCCTKWSSAVRSNHNNGGEDDLNTAFMVNDYFNCLDKFLVTLSEAWDHLQRHGRSWEQYFGVLHTILQLGDQEARLTVEADFLGLAIEFIQVHVLSIPGSKRLRTKYATYLLQRERNRPFAHGQLIQFFADLLPYVDLTAQATDNNSRLISGNRIGPSKYEAMLLTLSDPVPGLSWLKRIICGRNNAQAADSIVSHLCGIRLCDQTLCKLLKEGLADRNLLFATAFLQPTLTFASSCSVLELIEEVIEEALALIETTNGQYGKDFLTFVEEVIQLSNNAVPFAPGFFRPLVKRQMPQWAPVLLTAPNDIHADVRTETADVVRAVLFRDMENLRTEDPRQYRTDVGICKLLASSCSNYVETNFNNARSSTIQPGQAAQITVIVEYCMNYFSGSASDEEAATRVNQTIEEFESRANGIVESVTEAEWNASSDFEALSEVDNTSETSN